MTINDSIREQSRKDPEQLEREIDQQRHHIDEIVQALEARFAPGEMIRKVLGAGKEGGGEFAHNLGATLKANPVPTLLTAAGLTWLIASQNRTSTYTTGATGQSRTQAMGEHMHDMRQGMSEKASAARQRTGESMHHAMDSARHGAQRANERFHTMLDDNPMAIGAMGIAIGALLGAVLPSTRREDELLGDKSDRLKDQMRHAAREGRDRVAEAGREVTRADGGDGAPAAAPASRASPQQDSTAASSPPGYRPI
jgi:hypothetical protein